MAFPIDGSTEQCSSHTQLLSSWEPETVPRNFLHRYRNTRGHIPSFLPSQQGPSPHIDMSTHMGSYSRTPQSLLLGSPASTTLSMPLLLLSPWTLSFVLARQWGQSLGLTHFPPLQDREPSFVRENVISAPAPQCSVQSRSPRKATLLLPSTMEYLSSLNPNGLLR